MSAPKAICTHTLCSTQPHTVQKHRHGGLLAQELGCGDTSLSCLAQGDTKGWPLTWSSQPPPAESSRANCTAGETGEEKKNPQRKSQHKVGGALR